MVNYLRRSYANYFEQLSVVSDGMYNDNGKRYVDFDALYPNHSSVDMLILANSYIVFVEFKGFEKVDNVRKWLQKKSRIQNIYLKGYESFLNICQELKKSFSYDEICRLDRRFVFVYSYSSSKMKIHNHLRGKLQKRLELLFSVNIMNCQGFENFLQRHNL